MVVSDERRVLFGHRELTLVFADEKRAEMRRFRTCEWSLARLNLHGLVVSNRLRLERQLGSQLLDYLLLLSLLLLLVHHALFGRLSLLLFDDGVEFVSLLSSQLGVQEAERDFALGHFANMRCV